MANSKQAKKRILQSEKNRQHNQSYRSMMRTFMKKTDKEINNNNSLKARECFKELQSILDSCASKGIIHKNKAARHKSRFNVRINSFQSDK